MKIRVIKDTYYNLEYIKGSEGRIIEFDGNKLPTWGEKIKGDKKAETKTQKQNEAPQNNNNEQNDGNKAPQDDKTQNNGENVNNTQGNEQNNDDIEKRQYLDLLINEAIEKDILIEDADKKSVDEQIAELEKELGKGK